MKMRPITDFLERFLSHKWGILWRGALCWTLGCLFLLSDEGTSFDSRFQIRGDRPVSQDIVLITIRPNEIASHLRPHRLYPEPNEVVDVTDSYYWDQKTWAEFLKKILAQNPKKIGVSFFFNENLGPLKLSSEQQSIFQNPKITWAAVTSSADRPLLPIFASYNRENIGSIDLIRDEDGVLRRFTALHSEIPHFIEKLSEKSISETHQINFKGSPRVFPQYTLTDVMNDRLSDASLRGKYVLIGPESASSTQYLSPLGPTHRAALLGQILDNVLTNSWIKRPPLSLYGLLFIGLEILSIFLITQYPHSVAFVFLVWLGTLISAFSVWVFDSFAIWLPVMSPLLLILTTWIIFIGYRANEIEQKNFQLKREQKALLELEQLKNNFVSLISHDLKTPIAKIRAVVERMMGNPNSSPEALDDLGRLKEYSEELNRYIQSILKVLRVESRDFKLHLEVGDINAVIENVIDQIRPLAIAKKISIQTQLEPLFSTELDYTLIREVILNVIENAVKYSHEDGQILVRSNEIDGFVRVVVEDNGPGISPPDLEQVWGKFVRGKDQELKSKGSGLGLYLVKYFVELHGGTVGIESVQKKGTRVFFQLPLELPDHVVLASEVV